MVRAQSRRARVALNGFVLSGELRPVMLVCVLAWMTSSAAPTPAGTLDAHHRRLAEIRSDSVVPLERLLDYLLLDVAVQRDRDLVAQLVLLDVDQWDPARPAAREPREANPAALVSERRRQPPTLAAESARTLPRPAWGRRSRHLLERHRARGPRPSRPGMATSRRGEPVGAKTLTEVAFSSSPPPTWTRWRAPRVPANRRT